jgi:hypothetical protein
MRFFNKIVFSKKEPTNKSDIWFDGKVWKIYLDGEWKVTQEFRDDISNPDWHASEGEAGHIENRTHCVDYPLCTLNKDNRSVWIGSFSQIYVAYNDIVEILKEEESLPLSGNLVRLEYDGYTVSLVEEEEGLIDLFINFDIKIFGVIKKLEDVFIPDTVVKTIPQSLSSTDKNQALTNLGIDPIVWKYICNPLIIEEGMEVPDELYDEDRDWLKYEYPAMYRFYDDIEFKFCVKANYDRLTDSKKQDWYINMKTFYFE